MTKKANKKIFLIHFHPLEQYPPIMNMIDYLSRLPDSQVIVVSNKATKSRMLKVYENHSSNVKIYRPSADSAHSMVRYVNYIIFYCCSLFFILKHKPSFVFYFETLSSWPALMYKKLKKSSVFLMAHYHEYTSTEEYNTRMFLSKWMHGMELKMYPSFSWISQTNPVRMEKFKADNKLEQLSSAVFHTLPNYPPQSWGTGNVKHSSGGEWPKRMVYVGSLGYKNMYLKEVVDWLANHQQEFTLDIYAYNINEEARSFLKNNPQSNIQYRGGCDYAALPGLLKNYDIGLVIYKPFSENTIHAVSNKVFEYLACGLDVWFSKDMTFTMQYVKEDSWPKIISVDFTQLDQFDYKSAVNRDGLSFKEGNYFSENVYREVAEFISTASTSKEP